MKFVGMRGRLSSAALAVLLLFAISEAEASYLLTSSPEEKVVYYARFPGLSATAEGKEMTKHTLLIPGQVERPMGLAVDSLRRVLYVADPGQNAVLAMHLFDHSFPSNHLTVGNPLPLFTDVSAHWVAVDTLGTVYCSDAEGGKIWSLPASAIGARLSGDEAPGPRDLYTTSSSDPVSRPQGLAADGFHLYWANGQPGQGTVARGLAQPFAVSGTGSGRRTVGDVLQLADNVDEAFGLCISSTRVFYTSRTVGIYSVPLGGGPPVEVASTLEEPRGCAYDGDNTIYVADAQGGKVYAFPGGATRIGQRRLTPTLEVPGAYGLAVYRSVAKSAVLGWGALVGALVLASAGLGPP